MKTILLINVRYKMGEHKWFYEYKKIIYAAYDNDEDCSSGGEILMKHET
jgi:hypothetical protein